MKEFKTKVELLRLYKFILEKPFEETGFNDTEIRFILERLVKKGKELLINDSTIGYITSSNCEFIIERDKNKDLIVSTTTNIRILYDTLINIGKELDNLIEQMYFKRDYIEFSKEQNRTKPDILPTY